MPDHESAVRALKVIEETGKASFPCIRFHDMVRGQYLYGDLYEKTGPWGNWKVGDRQQ